MRRRSSLASVHRALGIAVALTVALALAVPALVPALRVQAADQTLIIAMDQSDLLTLDPHREFEFTAAFICLNAYDTLVVPKGPQDASSFSPWLAKSWTVSPDGKEYTFQLRDDVKFAGGNPLTAEDVRFSLMRLKNIKGNPSWTVDPLKDVQVVDNYTVKTVLSDSFADWLAVLAGPNVSIVDSKAVMAHAGTADDGADKNDGAEEWLNQNSAGSGPFILKSWTKNVGMTLERNPNYWGGTAKVAGVEIRDVPSPATQKLQVENGDVDIAINITPDLAATMTGNSGIKIISGQTLDNLYMGLTTSADINPNLAKKEVRQAIRYAIDYEGVLALTNGQATRGPAVYSVGVLGLTQADADRINPKTDLDRAKALLASAGLSGGFTFDLEYGTGPSPAGVTYDSVAQKVQSDLKAVNINANLVPKEFSVMLTNYRAKKSQAVISYNQPDYLGPSDWADQMILNTWSPRLYYESTQARDMTKKADAETDPQKRIQMYQDILKLLLDEGPYVMLIQPKTQVVTTASVSGYEYYQQGTSRLMPVGK